VTKRNIVHITTLFRLVLDMAKYNNMKSVYITNDIARLSFVMQVYYYD